MNRNFWRRIKALVPQSSFLPFSPPLPADLSTQLLQEALHLHDKATVGLASDLKPTGNVGLKPGDLFCKGSAAVWSFSGGGGVMHICSLVSVACGMRFLLCLA